MSRGMPCFFLSSEVTNLDRRAHRISRTLMGGAAETPRLVSSLQVLQKVFSIEHGDERSGGSWDDDDGRPGTFDPNKTVNTRQQPQQHLNEGREVPFF